MTELLKSYEKALKRLKEDLTVEIFSRIPTYIPFFDALFGKLA